jgi:hypothetical protein
MTRTVVVGAIAMLDQLAVRNPIRAIYRWANLRPFNLTDSAWSGIVICGYLSAYC